MFRSQLKSGAFLSFVVLALQNLVGLLYTPFMLRMMGKLEYGLYSIATFIVAYLTILDFVFGNAVVRYTKLTKIILDLHLICSLPTTLA